MLNRTTLLLVLIASSCANARPYDFLDNYRDPAPSPEDGPPASANASRDKSLLPGQICGIVGGYAATVLIWGVLLLTIGRRMRRRTQESPKTLELELVNARAFPTSPRSARSATSWIKKLKKEKPTDSAVTSPVADSPASFDQKVLEADKERAQAEMERLYAAVMDHDRKKHSQASINETEISSERRPSRPSNIDTSRDISTSNPSSPAKPGYASFSGPTTAPLPRDHLRDQQPPASPRSILSKKSNQSNNSSTSKTRFNLKNLRISGPITKYPGEGTNDEARTPLSPRYYDNPGAPPSPPTQQNSPTSPAEMEAYEDLDQVQPLPRPAPQRKGSSQNATANNAPSATKSASSSSNSLPLRSYNEPLKSPTLQTTFVDRRVDKLSMQTPKTGVPYTPYSPYMPFTPVTPVTPHLVTKKEKRGLTKIGGRKVSNGDDMVQSPKEIWGDAY